MLAVFTRKCKKKCGLFSKCAIDPLLSRTSVHPRCVGNKTRRQRDSYIHPFVGLQLNTPPIKRRLSRGQKKTNTVLAQYKTGGVKYNSPTLTQTHTSACSITCNGSVHHNYLPSSESIQRNAHTYDRYKHRPADDRLSPNIFRLSHLPSSRSKTH